MKEGIGQFETADEEGLALNEISIMKISTQKKVCVDFNFKEGNVKGKRTSKNMRPVYNNDKLFYTPGFQNDEEKISS